MMVKNRIRYALFVFLIFIVAYLFDDRPSHTVLIAAFVLPILSIAAAAVSYHFLEGKSAVGIIDAVKGDKKNYAAEICNKSYMPCPNIRIRFTQNSKAFYKSSVNYDIVKRRFFTDISIAPKGKNNISADILCRYRGRHEIGTESIEIFDCLGIFSLKKRIDAKTVLQVRPRILDINSIINSSNGQDQLKNKEGAVETEYRSYRPGDKVKLINWKLTAKQNEFVVKDMVSGSQKASEAFLIDLSVAERLDGDARLEYEDRIVETSVALAYSLKQNTPFHIISRPVTQKTVFTAVSFEDVYEHLSFCEFEGGFVLDDALEKYLMLDTKSENIRIITGSISDRMCGLMMSAKSAGVNISLVYTGEKSSDMEQSLNALEKSGITIHRISTPARL